jgi:ribosomal-protein-alanine N-acetyltransferase
MKYEMPILETDRLVLKRGTYEDFLKVYEYDFTRLRNIAGEFEFVKTDPEVVKKFVDYADEDYVLDYVLFLKENNEPIGNVTIDRYDDSNKSLEIACNLHPTYWRQGYMTEAILRLMRYIFDNLDIDNIRYGYAEENYKSKALNDKIGFKYNGYSIGTYFRIGKDIKAIETIMSKEDFYQKYGKSYNK